MSFQPFLFQPRAFSDDRGWFSETYSRDRLNKINLDVEFVQDNHSKSVAVGTVRGIHFQAPPHAQGKLVRCIRGSIMDFAVDLRRGSPTFGQSVSALLSAENRTQLYVPVGYGHGFVTLEPDTEVVYKVTDIYAPQCEGGVIWNDPGLGIDWPLPVDGAKLSQKDERLPLLADLQSPFAYDGEPLQPLTMVAG
jgi:dTDP-4-dehydrorhamnose 3,5-epimerase